MERMRTPIVALLLGGLCLPGQVLGETKTSEEAATAAIIRNVELDEAGVARGLVVDAAGKPCRQPVEVHVGETVHQITPDEHGRIAVAGMTGGACVVKVGEAAYGCRLWVHGTAPPRSLTTFIIVNEKEPIIRGQDEYDEYIEPEGGYGYLNPIAGMTRRQLLGFGVLAAGVTVAIVVAAQDDGDASN